MVTCMNHRTRRLAGEDGMTLVELMISMLILSMVLLAFLTIIPLIQTAFNREANRSSSNDQARLAVEELDREIRSGNLLYDPANEVADPAHGIVPYMSLRVYTQANADSRIPGTRCVQWRIYQDKLWRRAWEPNWAPGDVVEGWRIVATGIVNNSVTPAVNAFQLDADPAKGGRTLTITILSRTSTSSGSSTPVQINESVTGRDTEYGYPSQVCSTIPPY
jgi:prepilin-type N-terminal cleavage/methylation domain-containing protein